MLRFRFVRTLGFVTVLAITMSACGSGDQETLTVYSGRSENLVAPLLEMFTEETGIEVAVRYNSSSDLALLVELEGDLSPADVFISQSPGALGFLDQLGVLDQLEPDVLASVAPEHRGDDGRWVGLSGRVRVLVYNKDLVSVEDLPTSIFDLTDPAFAGQVAVAPANGSFQDFVTALRFRAGEEATAEWLVAMAANGAPTYANNSAIVQAVGLGAVPMGLVNHYYNHRAVAEDPNVASVNHYFDEGDVGSVIIVTGAAVLNASEHSEAANQLVAFLLSPAAQEFFAQETFEYPLVPGVDTAGGVPALSQVSSTSYDISSLEGGLERTLEMIHLSGLSG
jgi:iron(III) transport system substrate-binding protein